MPLYLIIYYALSNCWHYTAVLLSIVMLCQYVGFVNGSTYVQVFFLSLIYIYVLLLEIKLSQWEAWDIITWFNLTTSFSLSQSKTWTSNGIWSGIFLYWWNSWPSLFKYSFHNDWFILVPSYYICTYSTMQMKSKHKTKVDRATPDVTWTSSHMMYRLVVEI